MYLVCKRSVTKEAASSPSGSKGHSRAYIPGPGSDSTSMSADSPGSRQSQLTASSVVILSFISMILILFIDNLFHNYSIYFISINIKTYPCHLCSAYNPQHWFGTGSSKLLLKMLHTRLIL